MAKVVEHPLDKYVVSIFAKEDEILTWIQDEADRNGIPSISIRPDEGRLLNILLHAIGAKKIVEIGILAGYSGVWMARALPADGKMYALDMNRKHIDAAKRSYERAGVADKVEILEGAALESLAKLDGKGPFDFIFIDADKPSYPQYLAWAVENLRVGGIVAAHNAFRGGRITDPQSEEDRQFDAFNREVGANERLESTIIGIGDGMLIGIKKH